MIAAAREAHETLGKRLLGPNGQPFPRANRQVDMGDMVQRPFRRIRAGYDAAGEQDSMRRYWAGADALDADSANSRAVRQKLVSRSRYEFDNNPYYAGIVRTHANYLIGTGPKLRMQTGNKPFNDAVEAIFKQWAAAIQLQVKLGYLAQAKTRDGEGIGIVATNPRLRTRVKLDIRTVETEQCQTPGLWFFDENYIDGIKFDDFGNPLWYDILPSHPGSVGSAAVYDDPVPVPADFVLHWFRQERPGQHRGIPELTSSLNCGAAFRRLRDATLMANELAADFAVLLHTTMAPDDADMATPYSTAEINKGMITALPFQYDAKQLEAKHPNSTYAEFHKSQVSEQARPLNMPYNVAACDSSSYNYASGRLDHQTYFSSLDVERENLVVQVLDKLFLLWWPEVVAEYSFNSPPGSIPAHTWDLPQHPVADVRAAAIANNFNLRNGSTTIPQLASDAGYDAEEQAQAAADYFGISVEELKSRQLDALFPPTAEELAKQAQDAADESALLDREEQEQAA